MAFLRALLAALLLAALPAFAHAAWYRAETDGFIVYGAGPEAAVRDYAARLQTYDAALRLTFPAAQTHKAATKVQVYLVPDVATLQRVQPRLAPGTQGFYVATTEGVFAIVVSGSTLGGQDVLFHEYAHHFMFENLPAAYPAWYVEGFAEYFMTAKVRADSVVLGGENQARVNTLLREAWMPLEEVLSKTTGEIAPQRLNAYYTEAWVLTHYMRSNRGRAAQLDRAIEAMAAGAPPVQALQDATGKTIAQLTEALQYYFVLGRTTVRGFTKPQPPVVTPMPESADAVLVDNLRLILAGPGRTDPNLLAGLRAAAERYPDDELAQTTRARAEYMIGDIAAGEAATSRLLAARPDDPDVLLLAGTGELVAGLREPRERIGRWRAARPLLARAYGLRRTDFRIQNALAMSRSVERGFPTGSDLTLLVEAQGLAPAVQDLSIRAGVGLLVRGRRAEAARVLSPVVNSPHGGPLAAQARALLEHPPVFAPFEFTVPDGAPAS